MGEEVGVQGVVYSPWFSPCPDSHFGVLVPVPVVNWKAVVGEFSSFLRNIRIGCDSSSLPRSFFDRFNRRAFKGDALRATSRTVYLFIYFYYSTQGVVTNEINHDDIVSREMKHNIVNDDNKEIQLQSKSSRQIKTLSSLCGWIHRQILFPLNRF